MEKLKHMLLNFIQQTASRIKSILKVRQKAHDR